MEWDAVIGLEVHAQLKTKSKLFSGASTAFGATPNTQTSFIDAGLPGVLPVLNQEVVTMAIQFALATQSQINDHSIFERKNYFYPDLPKGYQISQFQKPIVSNGSLTIQLNDGREKVISIVRAHLEEDAGKSLHESQTHLTGIDLNRAGTPLLEIVTAPCMNTAEEVIAYLKTLHQLLRFLGICDGNMQEGSFRCDVNFSLKPKNSKILGTRTEIKNLNSFRNIEKALAYEQQRHQDVLESGNQIVQETRLYNPDTDKTYSMRSKENENDYRYFPDPDLLPIHISDQLIAKIQATLPELPQAISHKLQQIQELNNEDILFLLSSPQTYAFYKQIRYHSQANDKLIINWLKGSYAAALNEQQLSFDTLPVSAEIMANLLNKIYDKSLSNHNARLVFQFLWNGEQDIAAIIQREGYGAHQDNSAIEELVKKTLKQYPDQVAQYHSGKDKLLGFFVGQIMKQAKGQANPEHISELVKKYL